MDTQSDNLDSLENLDAEAPKDLDPSQIEGEQAVEAADLEVLDEEAQEGDAQQEVNQWRDSALRATAELENFRKRMVREKAETLRYANQRILEDLLPVIDNFEMGLQAAGQDEKSMIFLGMQMVKDQLVRFLEDQGVKLVETTGVFDPNFHEALAEEVNAEVPVGHIVRAQRKGYILNDRLLRAAAVVVSRAAEETEGGSN